MNWFWWHTHTHGYNNSLRKKKKKRKKNRTTNHWNGKGPDTQQQEEEKKVKEKTWWNYKLNKSVKNDIIIIIQWWQNWNEKHKEKENEKKLATCHKTPRSTIMLLRVLMFLCESFCSIHKTFIKINFFFSKQQNDNERNNIVVEEVEVNVRHQTKNGKSKEKLWKYNAKRRSNKQINEIRNVVGK